MPTITLTLPISGTVITAGLHSTNYASIQAAVNALDNTNIAVSANIDPLKLASGWTAYTPVWASGGVAPVLNNGTITGKYTQLGKTVIGRVALTAGSTTTFGSGTYTFSLPVAANAGTPAMPLGVAVVFDSSASTYYEQFTELNTTTTVTLFSPATSGAAAVSATVPVTLAVSDAINVGFTYEAA